MVILIWPDPIPAAICHNPTARHIMLMLLHGRPSYWPIRLVYVTVTTDKRLTANSRTNSTMILHFIAFYFNHPLINKLCVCVIICNSEEKTFHFIGCQSTSHTVVSSHGHLVTTVNSSQRLTRHTVNSSLKFGLWRVGRVTSWLAPTLYDKSNKNFGTVITQTIRHRKLVLFSPHTFIATWETV